MMRTVWTQIIGVLCIAAVLVSSAEAELVLHYDMSERGGEVLHDRSGKGHDALIHGAQWVTTESGAALDFDAIDDFVLCGNPAGLRISGALTLAVWVRTTQKDKNQYVLSKHGWNIYIAGDGVAHMETRNTANSAWVDLAATRPIKADGWSLIVAVHDPARHQMRMFIDGEPAGELTRGDETIGATGGDALSLGRYMSWPPDFDGLIGGVMIFDEALSAERAAGLNEQRPDDGLVLRHRLAVTPRRYYRARRVGADLQLQPRGPLASKRFSGRVELLDADGKGRGGVDFTLGADLRAHAEVAIPGEPGKYKIRAVLRGRKDILAQTIVPIEVKPLLEEPAPSWIGSQAGINRDVPPPWTPLQTKRKRGSVVVEPLGRRYEFKGGALASAISVGEHELLAGPVRLIARTRRGELRKGRFSLTVTDARADRVELSGATSGSHPVKVGIAVDYDGMMWFDWKISGARDPITGVVLEVPLKAEHARYLWHSRIPGEYAAQRPGFLPDAGFTGAFLPVVWLGDEDRGLQWFTESDEGWNLEQPGRAIEIVREGDRVVLRVNMIDAPTDAGKSISGSFGLQATPMKPWGKTPWDYRFRVLTGFPDTDLYSATKSYYEAQFDGYVKDEGIRTVTFFETWADAHSYVRTPPEKAEKLKRMVKAVQARGMQALLYFGGFISGIAPEADLMWDECVVLPEAGWDDTKILAQPRQKIKAVCYNSVWQDLVAEGIAEAMDEYGFDGVYLDGVGQGGGCINTHHGCGYIAPDGSLRPTGTLLVSRKLLERIYKIVKSRKPEGQVKLHHSGQMAAPLLAFGTSYWDGEQITGSTAKDRFLLDALPLDMFRTEFTGRQYGVPAEMLQYRLPGTHHQKQGLFLLHDTTYEGALSWNAKLWRLADEFGYSDATWLPYWSNSESVTVRPEQVKASLYRHPRNGVLTLVFNTGREAVEISVQLNLDEFEDLKQATAAEGFSGKEVEVTAGRFSLKLESLDWRFVWVKP